MLYDKANKVLNFLVAKKGLYVLSLEDGFVVDILKKRGTRFISNSFGYLSTIDEYTKLVSDNYFFEYIYLDKTRCKKVPIYKIDLLIYNSFLFKRKTLTKVIKNLFWLLKKDFKVEFNCISTNIKGYFYKRYNSIHCVFDDEIIKVKNKLHMRKLLKKIFNLEVKENI